MIIIPLSIYIADVRKQRIQQNELSETLDKLKLPIDLGKDTTVYNIECKLKTRYSNENIELAEEENNNATQYGIYNSGFGSKPKVHKFLIAKTLFYNCYFVI